jgi:hypothetical protein
MVGAHRDIHRSVDKGLDLREVERRRSLCRTDP